MQNSVFLRTMLWTTTPSALLLTARPSLHCRTKSAMEADILDGSGKGAATAIPGIPPQQVLARIDWTPDGHLLVSEGIRLLRLAPDGSDVTTLLSDSNAWMREVASCDGGRSIYAVSCSSETTPRKE